MESKQPYPTIKDFVIQQAHEKAFERLVMGLKEYQKEKQKIVGEKIEILQKQFEKRHKENKAQRRINKSSRINDSRMKKMNARHENLQELVVTAQQKLAQDIIRNETKYKALLKNLIVEGLIKMLEPIVYIRTLEKDRRYIKELIPQCKREFRELVQREGIDEAVGQVDLRVDERYSLTEKSADNKERLKKSEQSNVCFGGVIMTNEDGLIVCKNTIDARLQLAYQHLLPNIRSTLYSE